MSNALTVSLLLLANSFLLASAFSTVYDDTYSRWLVKVNGAAYSSNPEACIKNIPELGGDWSVVKVYQVECSPTPLLTSQCQVIILKSDAQKQYIISYRGTVGGQQLIEQFVNSIPLPFEKYGKVNGYQQKAFYGLWPEVTKTIANAKKEGYQIVVTGYSLGGALATITALKVVDGGYQTTENVYLLTYGSPRVGDNDFTSALEKNIKYRHRVVNRADPVPNIPPCWPSLLVIGGIQTCSRWVDGYYHEQQEIWYPIGSESGAPYISTTHPEDPRGSNQLGLKRKLTDHVAYFGYDLEKYGLNNCIDS